MTRCLIVGADGQLATELARTRLPAGWTLDRPGRAVLDLTKTDAIAGVLKALAPDIVINAAAYTAVDRAEDESAQAFLLNRDGPAALARACAAIGAPLVHISTDYVFGGDKTAPYVETDPKAPISVYGRSKAEGEDAVLSNQPQSAVLRTSWVFSAHGANFVKTMLRLGAECDEVRVVSDQHGRPTAAADLAAASIAVAAMLRDAEARATGVFHFANAGDTTWADFAAAIFEGAARRGRKPVRVRRIAAADYPTRAARPANSRLDTAKIETQLEILPRPWRIALDEVLDELLPR